VISLLNNFILLIQLLLNLNGTFDINYFNILILQFLIFIFIYLGRFIFYLFVMNEWVNIEFDLNILILFDFLYTLIRFHGLLPPRYPFLIKFQWCLIFFDLLNKLLKETLFIFIQTQSFNIIWLKLRQELIETILINYSFYETRKCLLSPIWSDGVSSFSCLILRRSLCIFLISAGSLILSVLRLAST